MIDYATDLPNADLVGKSDPYVIISFRYHDVETKELKDYQVGKTKVISNNLNPVWQETFEIDIANLPEKPKINQLLFEVYDKDMVGSDYLGMGIADFAEVNRQICKDSPYACLYDLYKKNKDGTRGEMLEPQSQLAVAIAYEGNEYLDP